jgi:Flp pilus assembly protein TadD
MIAPLKLFGIAAASLVIASCGSAPDNPSTQDSRSAATQDKAQKTLQTAARVSEETGDYGSAVNYFRKLYEKDQTNPAYIVGLSRNLRYGGKSAEARLFMDIIVGDTIDGPDVRAEYGKTLLSDGLPDKAVENLTKAIEMGATYWRTYSALGAAQDRLANFESAQKAYAAASLLSPENPSIINNQALSLALSGQLKSAIKLLESVVARPGTTPKLRQNLAMLHALDGDLKAAKSLGRVDLSDSEVQKNLEYYQEFLNGIGSKRRR